MTALAGARPDRRQRARTLLRSHLDFGPRPSRAVLLGLAGALAVQRIAVPGTQLPLLVPLVYVAVAIGLYRGALSFDVARLRLFLMAAVLVVASTLTAVIRGLAPSVSSALLVLGVYACGTLVLTAPTWAGYRALLGGYVRVMSAFAGLGTLLFGLQWAGLAYSDWLAAVLPDQMLLTGYYTTNPLLYGSPYQRANGLVFLEPSFFSLFCGLGLAAALYLRVGLVPLGILATGLITSVSGNGMVVATAAIAVLVVTRQWRSLAPMVVPAIIVAIAMVAYGLGPILLSRLTEVTRTDSSASMRFVQPYDIFADHLMQSVPTLLIGQGAGTADTLATTVRADLVAPIIPKVVYEYGLITAVLLLAMLVSMTLSRVPTWVVGAGLALVYWIVNPSLLVPLVPFTVFTFMTLWAPLRSPARGPDPGQ
ncbi:hypothetical protein [Modestobacter marinus]|uniref:hypothetical protein n=1 Tax=Modestobacter marinus TaxID=477641 RepID=UPI001C973869|nr:hypothetical protein [Modestobacter marinus]